MRYARLALVALFLATLLLAAHQRQASASFHCMRVHAVMAGFSGNNNIQFVELRMSAAGQPFVFGHILRFYDGSGTLKASFTFPASVSNSSTGDSILIATQEFNNNVLGGTANFVFSMANTTGVNGGDPLHPIQGPSGKVSFGEGQVTCIFGGPSVVDSVAYGSYGGTVDFGTAAVALPSPSDNRSLRLSSLKTEGTNNSAQYSLQAVSATTFSVAPGSLTTNFTSPRNNGRTVLQLQVPTPTPTPLSVGGVAEPAEVAGGPAAGSSSGAMSATRTLVIVAATAGAVMLGGIGVARAVTLRRRRD